MKKGICLLAAILLLAMPGSSPAVGLEMAIGGWDQNIEGEVCYEGNNRNDIIDLKDDAALDDETRVMGRVKVDMPAILPNIYIMATPMEFEGKGDKDVNFDFGDVSVSANTDFETRVTMDHVDVGLYYSIPFVNLASLDRLNIDLGLNLKVADLEAEVKNKETGLSDAESYTLPLPMVYAAVQVQPIERLSLEAEARAVSLSGNHLYNLIGRIKGKIFGPMFLAGGYRYDSINLDEEDIVVDCSVEGVFLETGFEF